MTDGGGSGVGGFDRQTPSSDSIVKNHEPPHGPVFSSPSDLFSFFNIDPPLPMADRPLHSLDPSEACSVCAAEPLNHQFNVVCDAPFSDFLPRVSQSRHEPVYDGYAVDCAEPLPRRRPQEETVALDLSVEPTQGCEERTVTAHDAFATLILCTPPAVLATMYMDRYYKHVLVPFLKTQIPVGDEAALEICRRSTIRDAFSFMATKDPMTDPRGIFLTSSLFKSPSQLFVMSMGESREMRVLRIALYIASVLWSTQRTMRKERRSSKKRRRPSEPES